VREPYAPAPRRRASRSTTPDRASHRPSAQAHRARRPREPSQRSAGVRCTAARSSTGRSGRCRRPHAICVSPRHDETYVKIAGRWRYLYRAVDQYGHVIDVLLSEQRATAAARRFFTRALRYGPAPVEVTTDKAGPYLRILDEPVPAAAHVTEQHANTRVEADHGRLKARLRPMRGRKRFPSAAVIARGHTFVQNLRRGHYELAIDVSPPLRLATAFRELALAM
jgi:transposase, IS6 family